MIGVCPTSSPPVRIACPAPPGKEKKADRRFFIMAAEQGPSGQEGN
jgi:hypothetical protein